MDSDTSTLLKVAYLKGIHQAEQEEGVVLEKNALLGRLGWGAAKGIGKGLGWGLNKTVGAAGRGIGRRAANLGRRAGRAITQKVAPEAAGGWGMVPWRAGQEAGRFGKAMFSSKHPGEGGSKLFHALTGGGRKLPAEMLRYGTFSGTIGGLTGDPNTSWDWGGAGRGFLGGAAGGAGWHFGGKVMKGVLGAGLKSKPFMGQGALGGFGTRARSIMGVGQKGGKTIYDKGAGKSFGELWKKPHGVSGGKHIVDPSMTGLQGLGASAKDIGIKTLTGVPLVAGMLGGSILAEEGTQQAMDAARSAPEQQPWLTPGYGALSPEANAGRAGYGANYGARYMR